MNNIDKLSVFDNIEEKYITEAMPRRIIMKGTVKKEKADFDHHPFAVFESVVSAAAIFLVLGAILVWTLVGKDIMNAYWGKDTTDEVTTTQPDTTPDPVTTTNNVVVPPVTDTTTTTPAATTTQPPVTVEPKPNPNGFDPQIVDFEHLWEIGYQMGWPTEKLYGGIAYRVQDTRWVNGIFTNLENFAEDLPQCILSQSFYSTDQIDFMKVMFSLCETPVNNEDEFQKVAAVVMATENMDKWELMAGGMIYKITTEDVEYVNDILAEYFHDSFTDQMMSTLSENTFYIEEFNAYYTVLEGDYRDLNIKKLENAWIMENGNIVLSISNATSKANARAYYLSLVVIRNVDDKWVIDQIMHISKEIANNLSSNADTSIFDDSRLLKRLRESELKIDSLILEDWSEDCLQDIFDLLTTKGIGYALVRDYSGDPLNISVRQLINATRQHEMTDEELEAYLKIRYEREKAADEAFNLTFEDYYNRMYGFDFSWCTSATLSANLQKFFGISFTDEIKEYCDSQAVYVQEFDKYVTDLEMSFLFVEFEVYKISTGQILLIIPDFDGDSYNNSAKAVVLSSSEDGYVISQIATIEY